MRIASLMFRYRMDLCDMFQRSLRFAIPALLLSSVMLAQTPEQTSKASLSAEIHIKMGVIPGALRYDLTRFDLPLGSPLEIVFTNNGLMPHNLLVVKPGRTDAVVAAAMALGAKGQAQNYVPKVADVLAATKLVQPGKVAHLRVTFSAVGDYGYVCTFPGHGTIMRGSIRVRAPGRKLEPQVRRELKQKPRQENRLAATETSAQPMGSLAEPYVIRTFMPEPGLDASVLSHHVRGYDALGYDVNSGRDLERKVRAIPGLPAAIGVSFGPVLSICWDTVECRLLYAWTGGFLDMAPYWGARTGGRRRPYGYVPRLRGKLIHKTAGPHPLAAYGSPEYLGYKLQKGIPVFKYRLGPYLVEERVTPGSTALAINSELSVSGARQDLVLRYDPSVTQCMSVSRGQLTESKLVLPSDGTARVTFTATLRGELPVVRLVERALVLASARRQVKGEKLGPAVELGGLDNDALIFRDRDYVFRELPKQLIGADYVQTYNGDKSAKKPVSWVIEAKHRASLFLLLDTRIAEPQWLTGKTSRFVRTELRVETSGNWTYSVYRTELDAGGSITLGSQSGGSFYAIAAIRGLR